VRGLLAPLTSKNGCTLAEAAGDATPDGMQRLLNAAAWETAGPATTSAPTSPGTLAPGMAIRARWYSGGAVCPGAGR
jgi:hypothetical protein